MKIEKLKPGMIVYDVHSHKMGNTNQRSVGVWEVIIESVDCEAGTVTARWNHNPPQKYYRHTWSKWREKEPVFIKDGYSKRIATRAEIKAMNEKEQL